MPKIEKNLRGELARTLRRGRLAQELIKKEIWENITDHLADRQAKIALEALWHGEKSVEETAMRSAMHSGRSIEIEYLVKMLHNFIKDGREAEIKLKELGITI